MRGTEAGFMMAHNSLRHYPNCDWSKPLVVDTLITPCTCRLLDDIADIEEEARKQEHDRIIEVIANVPVTIKFKEPVTRIDVWQYHADVINAIQLSKK